MRMRRLPGLLALIICAPACDELPVAEGPTVTVEVVEWPDSVGVNELATVRVTARGGSGGALTGISLRWETTDSSVLTVSQLLSPSLGDSPVDGVFTATIAGHLAGSANLVVTAEHPGFSPASASGPVAVSASAWPAGLTVTGEADIVLVAPVVPAEVLAQLSCSVRSDDPSVISVESADCRSPEFGRARMRAHRSGRGTLTMQVERVVGGGVVAREVFGGGFNVDAFRVVSEQWVDALNVTNSATATVRFLDADSVLISPDSVSWESSNEGVMTVVPGSSLNEGVVTATGRGVADLVVTARGEQESVVFRRRVEVRQKWVKVEAGLFHTCAIAVDEYTYCWGRGPERGNFAGFELGVPVRVATLLEFEQVAAGGVGTDDANPTQVQQVSQGDPHSCGATMAAIYCWGDTRLGQLGDGTDCNGPGCTQVVPTEVDFSTIEVFSLDAGARHACAVGLPVGQSADVVMEFQCWGLKNEPYGWGIAPRTVWNRIMVSHGLQRNAHPYVVAGARHACFANDQIDTPPFANDTIVWGVHCVGSNRLGQLGDSVTVTGTRDKVLVASPVLKTDGSPVDIGRTPPGFDRGPQGASPGPLSSGAYHTCGVSVQELYCWGFNSRRQLGPAAPPDSCAGFPCSRRAVLVPVDGVVTVATGAEHTCAIGAYDAAAETNLYCWGSNAWGQLGDGLGSTDVVTFLDIERAAPQPVLGGHVFTWISAGSSHTCGVDDEGSIYCWGRNAFQSLGVGANDRIPRHSPVRVVEPQN